MPAAKPGGAGASAPNATAKTTDNDLSRVDPAMVARLAGDDQAREAVAAAEQTGKAHDDAVEAVAAAERALERARDQVANAEAGVAEAKAEAEAAKAAFDTAVEAAHSELDRITPKES
jgi:hypothetical protein